METQSDNNQDNNLAVLAQRDTTAFGQLYEKYFPRLYAFVQYKINVCTQEYEDLVSEIFEKVLENLDKYNPKKGNFAAWFFTIASNHIKNQFRKKHTMVPFEHVENTTIKPEQGEQIRHSLEAQEEKKRIAQALKQLPERERKIVALKFGSEYTYEEIAAITGLSIENCRVITFRAVRKLRKEIVLINNLKTSR